MLKTGDRYILTKVRLKSKFDSFTYALASSVVVGLSAVFAVYDYHKERENLKGKKKNGRRIKKQLKIIKKIFKQNNLKKPITSPSCLIFYDKVSQYNYWAQNVKLLKIGIFSRYM